MAVSLPPNVAISLRNLSVSYFKPVERIPSMKEYVIRRMNGKHTRKERFDALNDVTFDVEAGQAIGVIGNNGAGKSTLLRVMARIIKPTSGRLIVRGKVAPLLALGGGFHPELSGRENVFLYGSLIGHTREEMQAHFDRIVDFAGLRSFIDAPLRTYSSGMVARLGFSIATDIDPDILLIDEVLAVGDKDFQHKSAERMRSFYGSGATIVLVTHALQEVETMCQQAVWLDRGVVRAIGPAKDVVKEYQASGQ